MKTTMKQRITKSILAAAMALVTVAGTAQYGITRSITARALCGHHCYHNTVYTEWKDIRIEDEMIGFLKSLRTKTQTRDEYDECSSCHLRTYRRSHCRKVYIYFCPLRGLIGLSNSWEVIEDLY